MAPKQRDRQRRAAFAAPAEVYARAGLKQYLGERDIVRMLGRAPPGQLKRPVSECMTANVVTCPRDTPVADLMEQMTRFRIRHMPVVEDGELRGIVSIGDVVKRKIEETEQEAVALREYIAS